MLLRQCNRQPDGTYIVNKFWNEIYNGEVAQHAQATQGTDQLVSASNYKL
jgi:hypothetical protein